ncbi:MAG: aminotransferase class V-fold PLP-dependent enzyme, partial [Lachnospiraceae bacterium]|nr:aminotransferase class V-fold PLP-dependent enzyme [Lachnospiraceae bacterium]
MAELYERLRELRDSDIYPFHMPGHKRNWEQSPLREMLGIDITEIDGFDNLHHATGILKTMQEEAAAVYGTDQTFFLVNGSTCGIQAAVSASVKDGKKLLMARGCHKAVYNICLLRRIDAVYLYPAQTDTPFLCGSISPQAVEEAFARNDEIGAVILTSPNYDGVVSDVASIADIVHAHGAVLIVDEAHGAHLPFSTCFPKSAVRCGADLVIHSLHKTLPSPTQTALLHVNGDRVDADRLREFLSMYQTSSPSYIFMAAMQQCIEETAAKGDKWLSALSERLDAFVRACSSLTHIRLLSRDWALR